MAAPPRMSPLTLPSHPARYILMSNQQHLLLLSGLFAMNATARCAAPEVEVACSMAHQCCGQIQGRHVDGGDQQLLRCTHYGRHITTACLRWPQVQQVPKLQVPFNRRLA